MFANKNLRMTQKKFPRLFNQKKKKKGLTQCVKNRFLHGC